LDEGAKLPERLKNLAITCNLFNYSASLYIVIGNFDLFTGFGTRNIDFISIKPV
jgi:hypothetical protein